jgi:hypothetical protein
LSRSDGWTVDTAGVTSPDVDDEVDPNRRGARRTVELVVLGLLMIVAIGLLTVRLWPEPTIVGRTEQVTVVVEPRPFCNIELSPDDQNRHGMNWKSYGTWPEGTAVDTPTSYPAEMTYTAPDEAMVEVEGLVVRFKGRDEDNAFWEASCPINDTYWVTSG